MDWHTFSGQYNKYFRLCRTEVFWGRVNAGVLRQCVIDEHGMSQENFSYRKRGGWDLPCVRFPASALTPLEMKNFKQTKKVFGKINLLATS